MGITNRLWRRRKPLPRFVPIRNIHSNYDGLLSESKIFVITGTLFDTKAAADLTLRLETSSKKCELRVQKEKSLCEAKSKLDLDLKVAELESLEQRCNDILKIKTDQIDFLQKIAVKDVPWYKTNKFWMATGVVTGFVISLASVYAIGQVGQ